MSQPNKPESKPAAKPATPTAGKNPKVVLDTTAGKITIELWADKAPITVQNFLRYVDAGHYDGLIFHRVIDGFMIQGGGFTPDMNQRGTFEPIKNEAANGCKNSRGTIAMARTGVVDSATSQFFINVADNDFLDHRGKSPDAFGYCVFGKVADGIKAVDLIRQAPTGNKGGHDDVPIKPIVINSAKRA